LNRDVRQVPREVEEVEGVLGAGFVSGTCRYRFGVIYVELTPVCILGDFGRLVLPAWAGEVVSRFKSSAYVISGIWHCICSCIGHLSK
jgi:hypothetical protein